MTGTAVPGDPAQDGPAPATRLDPAVAHIARVRDYWLGGRDNFAVDREVGNEAMAAFPGLVGSVRAARAFLGRAVRYLTADAGIRQFLDIGAGIPTANSTHQVAQSIAPDALVCYVDRDPVVFGHARALLASGPHGAVSYLEADLRDTGQILAEAASMLDLTQPVAVLLNAVLQFIPDEAGPGKIVTMLLDAMPPGSYLVLSQPASDLGSEPRPDPASPLGRLLAQRPPGAATSRSASSSPACGCCRPAWSGWPSGGRIHQPAAARPVARSCGVAPGGSSARGGRPRASWRRAPDDGVMQRAVDCAVDGRWMGRVTRGKTAGSRWIACG